MGIVGHASVAILGMSVSAGLWVLGQNDPSIPDGLTALGPPIIGTGAAAWFLRWLLMVYIPEQNKIHEEQYKAQAASISQMADAHKEVTSSLSQSYERNLLQLREDYREDRNKFIEVLRGIGGGTV